MYIYNCKINKVIDGDTVDIDIDLGFNVILSSQRIRLFGVDAPESRTSVKEEKERGLLAKKKLSEKLPTGSTQLIKTIKLDDNDDKFGRILGIFILGDSTVNEWLVTNNYAVSYNGENKELLQEQHLLNKKKLIERGEIKG